MTRQRGRVGAPAPLVPPGGARPLGVPVPGVAHYACQRTDVRDSGRLACLTTDQSGNLNMKRAGPVFSLGSEFDDFLLAAVGDDHTGMQLSVLSALARLDVDPWEEAAALARLPNDSATQKLAALLAALPAGPTARADSRTIAARLIPLLPRRASAGAPAPARSSALPAPTRAPTQAPAQAPIHSPIHSPILTYLILYGVFTLFMLAVQWLVTTPQVPAAVSSAPAPQQASTAPQPLPPPRVP